MKKNYKQIEKNFDKYAKKTIKGAFDKCSELQKAYIEANEDMFAGMKDLSKNGIDINVEFEVHYILYHENKTYKFLWDICKDYIDKVYEK